LLLKILALRSFENLPRNEHGERNHHFAGILHHHGPPRLGGMLLLPLTHCNGRHPKPRFDKTPKPLGKPVMGKRVSRRLLSLLAKLAKPTIVRPFLLKISAVQSLLMMDSQERT
jgi:hypothetical protein